MVLLLFVSHFMVGTYYLYVHLYLSYHSSFYSWSITKNFSGAFRCTHNNFHHEPLQPALLAAFLTTPYFLRIIPTAIEWIAAIDSLFIYFFFVICNFLLLYRFVIVSFFTHLQLFKIYIYEMNKNNRITKTKQEENYRNQIHNGPIKQLYP